MISFNTIKTLGIVALLIIAVYGIIALIVAKADTKISVEYSVEYIGDLEEAVVAGGCFWGMQTLYEQLDGVVYTEVGYTGGKVENPSYYGVSSGNTGHIEALLVQFDPDKVTYEEIIKYFFNIHDPTEVNRQGPDIGEQYRSAIFYYSDKQKTVAEEVSDILRDKGYNLATTIEPFDTFWKAEDYHQDYYEKKGGAPYCHFYRNKF